MFCRISEDCGTKRLCRRAGPPARGSAPEKVHPSRRSSRATASPPRRSERRDLHFTRNERPCVRGRAHLHERFHSQSRRASANNLHPHLTSHLRWITKLRTIGVKRSTPCSKEFG